MVYTLNRRQVKKARKYFKDVTDNVYDIGDIYLSMSDGDSDKARLMAIVNRAPSTITITVAEAFSL